MAIGVFDSGLGGLTVLRAMAGALPDSLDDEAFINFVEATAFDYFWYEANPKNGLIKDRSTTGSASSIAAVGFGLSALTVGVDRGWLTREEAVERVLTTLEFFWNSPQSAEAANVTGYKGFYYHFLNMDTGMRSGTTELSTIDTALLMAGVIHAGEYFDGADEDELRIRNLADSLYLRVEWDWAQPRPPRIGHGWRPESGFIPFDWGGYNEAMIVYLLAFGSPTHGITSNAWTNWVSSYNFATYYGYQFVVFPPLFGHQYTHAWFDFRGIQDAYMRARDLDYFENSRRATLANRAYAIDNPKNYPHYGENIWGLTASDVPTGYAARGAPPAQNDDGTIAPTAAGGSFPFTPEESLAALREMYKQYRTQIWWYYGFRDAFNPPAQWFASAHLGIDQGPIVLMIENHRTGAIWEKFMQNEYVQAGLQKAGFAETVANEEGIETPAALSLEIFPNPGNTQTAIVYTLDTPGEVDLRLYDVLGREVIKMSRTFKPVGAHQALLDISTLSAGVYFVVLDANDSRVAAKLVVGK